MRPAQQRIDRLARSVAPLLLVGVALVQLTLAQRKDLTPWKGGGFGMFASVDRMERRPVRVDLLTDEGSFRVDPLRVLTRRQYRRIQTLPNPRVMQ